MLTYRGATLSLVVSLFCLAGSQILVKWRFGVLCLDSHEARSWPTWARIVLSDVGLWFAGLLIFGGAAAWYASMTRLPLSLMLPVGGVVSPLVAVGAHLLLGERLTPLEFVIILVIAGGVAALAFLQSQA